MVAMGDAGALKTFVCLLVQVVFIYFYSEYNSCFVIRKYITQLSCDKSDLTINF